MRRMLWIMGALALVAITALTTLALAGNFNPKPSATRGWDYKTEDVTEAEMLGSLVAAPADIKAALQRDAAKSKDALFIAASKRVYVATRDVAIGRVDVPTTVILPTNLHWTRGQAGNVVLLRVKEVTPAGVSRGYAFPEAMCNAEFIGIARNVCMDTEAQRPGTWDEMLTHLRRPDEPELAKWLGDLYVPDSANMYYVATSDFVAAPEYKYNVPGETLGIFMPPGIKVLGGQLGYMDLYKLSPDGKWTEIVMDSLCFMYDSPVIWEADKGEDAGRPNHGKPSIFAPEVELERVSGCKR